MRYRFTVREDHGDLASGSVLRSAPGHPAFPVRLASEIFQQARADLGDPGRRLTVLDPFAGSGYLLAVLGILHAADVDRLIAIDIDPSVRSLAAANLALTSQAGLAERRQQLIAESARTGNPAHAVAAESAARLVDRLTELQVRKHAVLTGDALDRQWIRENVGADTVDLVITDVPYGAQTGWAGAAASRQDSAGAVAAGLSAWSAVMVDGGVAVIVGPKDVRLAETGGWSRYRHVTIGHRRVSYFRRA